MSKKESDILNGTEKRASIKTRFRNGKIPSQDDFECLIDSMVNILDDGFSKSDIEGLKIYLAGKSKRFASFYRNKDEVPFFTMDNDVKDHACLKFVGNDGGETQNDTSSFFFHGNGKLGVGKRSNPNLKLDVNGIVGMNGRIGTYAHGHVLADRKWHPIISNVNHCQAFEIIARTGRSGSGRFAMMHAIALSTYGRSRNKIKKTSAWYGLFWNKISLRWVGDTNNYSLEMRTNSNYKDAQGDVNIYYSVTALWDDSTMVPKDYLEQTEPEAGSQD